MSLTDAQLDRYARHIVLSEIGGAGQRRLLSATVAAPWLRLDDFLGSRQMRSVRLLKLDIEGAEELALRGLGGRLSDHSIDFIFKENDFAGHQSFLVHRW